MKHWYLIPLAALAGLFAGSFGPKAEIAALREEAEKRAEQPRETSGFDAFTKIANIPQQAKSRRRRRAEEAPPAAADDERADGESEEQSAGEDAAAQTAAGTESSGEKTPPAAPAPEDLRERIDEAAELWRTRVAIAKSQWKAKLGIRDGEESERFDAEIDAMNDDLRETMAALAEAIAEQGRMTPELSLRMIGDATGAMAETYDRIAATVPESAVSEVAELPVFEFIDPSVAEPLIEVQDLMR